MGHGHEKSFSIKHLWQSLDLFTSTNDVFKIFLILRQQMIIFESFIFTTKKNYTATAWNVLSQPDMRFLRIFSSYPCDWPNGKGEVL
jgi:hypothetical protein